MRFHEKYRRKRRENAVIYDTFVHVRAIYIETHSRGHESVKMYGCTAFLLTVRYGTLESSARNSSSSRQQ